jgi:retron-type reverse transcriptase
VREAARRQKGRKFTALLHHVTVERLRAAFEALQPKAAAGVDGVTWEQYREGLDEKLVELHARVHRGAYRARPTRRAYIPKTDGRMRALGIAAVEDKVVQRAVVEVMNAVYEEDFLGFSYGFRAGRSQHHALDAFRCQVERHWLHALRRRGQRDGTNWKRLNTLSARWLPPPQVLHPWPDDRFYATTRGKSPVR